MRAGFGHWSALPSLLLITACASGHASPPSPPAPISQNQAKGPYLGGGPLPGGLDLLPPPPAAGSAAQARDSAGADAATKIRNSARWDMAASDANLAPGAVATTFRCAAGIPIGKEQTPALVRIIDRASGDLGASTGEVKKRYMRPRPFMVNALPTCTPTWEKALRQDGSYPSGHSAIGFGAALILAELLPDRAAQLVARGRAFGDSRRICNVHWLSDIEEGRVAAAATVMRLNANPAFQADLAAARAEIATLPPQPENPACEQERQTLSNMPASQ